MILLYSSFYLNAYMSAMFSTYAWLYAKLCKCASRLYISRFCMFSDRTQILVMYQQTEVPPAINFMCLLRWAIAFRKYRKYPQSRSTTCTIVHVFVQQCWDLSGITVSTCQATVRIDRVFHEMYSFPYRRVQHNTMVSLVMSMTWHFAMIYTRDGVLR